MKTTMLISVHLPKTAGSSFRQALKEKFGDSLQEDYADMPMQVPIFQRNRDALQSSIANASRDFSGISCIHGHFLPVKYLLLKNKANVRFVTWLRNPVDRMISHYYYWKNNYDIVTTGPLQRKMIEENWSLEKFCLCDQLKDFYCQYLWGFPLDGFDFIGLTEHYSSDIAYLSEKILDSELPVFHVNTGKSNEKYKLNRELNISFKNFHSKDVLLYETLLTTRKKRVGRNNFWKY